MKTFVAIIAASIALTSVSARAELVRIKKCDFRDHQTIKLALKHAREEQQQLASAIDALLSEEMGPACTVLDETEIMMGIPGVDVSHYLIEGSGERNFQITVGIDRINKGRVNTNIERK